MLLIYFASAAFDGSLLTGPSPQEQLYSAFGEPHKAEMLISLCPMPRSFLAQASATLNRTNSALLAPISSSELVSLSRSSTFTYLLTIRKFERMLARCPYHVPPWRKKLYSRRILRLLYSSLAVKLLKMKSEVRESRRARSNRIVRQVCYVLLWWFCS